MTLCVQKRNGVLGEIVRGAIVLSDWGRIAAQTWTWLREQYSYVALDIWVVMPDHLHGIIVLVDEEGAPSNGALLNGGARPQMVGVRRDAPLRDTDKHDAPLCDVPLPVGEREAS